eukprot:TRINITY_DN9064_c0_g1_i2.p1 TRINITY_DN9064_c0_g1~~TRINITY_DN9064_c0_g1_i2.p1  ORF type:complete len:320 (+),score=51.21 TRINITY_DN9064_c0_g1_i2:252-1211(+)
MGTQQIRMVPPPSSSSEGLRRSNSSASSSVTELQQRHRLGGGTTAMKGILPTSSSVVDDATPSPTDTLLSLPSSLPPAGGVTHLPSSSSSTIPATQVLTTRQIPPRLLPATPPPPNTSIKTNNNSQVVDEAAYTGRCALCGLDTANRAQMRKFLRSILAKDPTCCRADIIGLSEQAARTLFGPLVDFHPPPSSLSTTPPLGTRLGNGSGQAEAHQMSTSLHCHQLCLLWTPDIAVLTTTPDDEDNNHSMTTTSTPQYAGVNESLDAAHQRRCGFCGELGASFSPNHHHNGGGAPLYFHIPCALLTGDGVCIVDNSGHEE